MQVLITGSSGFVGKHVVKELEDEHELLTPSSQELNLLDYGPCYNNTTCDETFGAAAIASWMNINQVDAIVHLAATCGGIGINKDNPGKFIYENLQMGINILEAARLAKVGKIVNLSTVCAYPKHTPVPFKEEDIYNGYPEETNAPYGIAKRTVMEMGDAYSRQYNMQVTNLVPVNMAGEWDNFNEYSSHVIPAIIRKFEKPYTYDNCNSFIQLWGTGSASREFLYAGDCARAISIALIKDTGPAPINLGTGKEITIRDLAELIRRIGNYNVDIVWDNTKPDGQPRRCLNVSRAKNRLKWEATTTLEETISRTINWYRENV